MVRVLAAALGREVTLGMSATHCTAQLRKLSSVHFVSLPFQLRIANLQTSFRGENKPLHGKALVVRAATAEPIPK